MTNLELSNYGVAEMNNQEMINVEGGIIQIISFMVSSFGVTAVLGMAAGAGVYHLIN